MNISLGTDMEFFCKKDNKIVISQGVIPGTKHDPVQIAEGVLMHRDNCLGEFTVPPAHSKEEWSANIKATKKIVKKFCISKGISPVFMSYHPFDMNDLMDPECLTFGCQPDFRAMSNTPNPTPDPWSIGGARSAGGHIHIGYEDPNEETNCAIAMYLDMLLGPHLSSIEGTNGISRRRLYGRAGCIRHKPYGVEYRTPGPEWFAINEMYNIIWDAAEKAVRMAKEHPVVLDNAFSSDTYARTANCINGGRSFGSGNTTDRIATMFSSRFSWMAA